MTEIPLNQTEEHWLNISIGNNITKKVTYFYKWLMRAIGRKELLRVFGATQDKQNPYIEVAYVINLTRQSTRWKSFVREARRQKMERKQSLLDFCHRISAVDGKLLKPDEASFQVTATYPLDAQYYVDPDPRLLAKIREETVNINMTREETAVALSHIKAWKRIVADKISYALILEDDVFFERSFPSQLNQSWLELPKKRNDGYKFDLLYLSFREVEHKAQTVRFSPNLVQPIRGYWWLSGYVLSNSGAIKLLQSLPVTGPVDMWMNHLYSELDVYSTPYSVISQRTDLQSDNRYSILPLLSQLGVQMDKSHLLLEQKKGRSPVFGIGFDRKENYQLEAALSLLGYRCCNDKWGSLSDKIVDLINNNSPLLFDAYIDIRNIGRYFKQLDNLYPNVVFIIPSSPLETNNLSPQKHKGISAYFADNHKKLLKISISDQENWNTLCEFLECDIPSYPFPLASNLVEIPGSKNKFRDRIPIQNRKVDILQHDVHPWVIPYERLSAFGVHSKERSFGHQVGTFKGMIEDQFSSFDDSYWSVMEGSFPSNLAIFEQENIATMQGRGCRLTLKKKGGVNHDYSSAALVSNSHYYFGRFEVTMKPAKADGVITAFFLHRINPWQEIDMEVLGRDTTKLLTNVYFNPGVTGTSCNYGNRGTPIMINLNFDAAENFHRYTIEWEPHEMRWFVDGELIHVRSTWDPTPVPNLPLRLYSNIWLPRSTELAGELRASILPVSSYIKKINISELNTNIHYGSEQ